MSLNDRQARFVAEYLVDLNATQAAMQECSRTAHVEPTSWAELGALARSLPVPPEPTAALQRMR